jgi:hypothetical protein
MDGSWRLFFNRVTCRHIKYRGRACGPTTACTGRSTGGAALAGFAPVKRSVSRHGRARADSDAPQGEVASWTFLRPRSARGFSATHKVSAFPALPPPLS